MHCIRAGEREARLTALVAPSSGAAEFTVGAAAEVGAEKAAAAAGESESAASTGDGEKGGDAAAAAAAAAATTTTSATIKTFLVRFRESAQVDEFIRTVDRRKGSSVKA
jgi:hypothetical protein